MNILFRYFFVSLLLGAVSAQAAEPVHDHQHGAAAVSAAPSTAPSAMPSTAMNPEACPMMLDGRPGMGPRGGMMNVQKPGNPGPNHRPMAGESCPMHSSATPCTKCEAVQQRLKAVEQRLDALERAAKPTTK